jgi:uncharacterized protein (DUF305 family)
MKQHPILYALIGFILGGLVVSVAAKFLPYQQTAHQQHEAHKEVMMSEMTTQLKDKKGDDYDALFLAHMIEHHQAAVDMSKLSPTNAKHEELKKMSADIIAAQEKEIAQMKQWQTDWGYSGEHKMNH